MHFFAFHHETHEDISGKYRQEPSGSGNNGRSLMLEDILQGRYRWRDG